MLKLDQSSKNIDWIAFLVILFFICFIFRDYIITPSKMLVSGGDGSKNYFTFLYHIKHDSSYWRFDGMNYPFGENIIFTDNQPLVSNVVKLVHQIIPLTTEQCIGIHNWILIFSILIGGMGIFLVLRQLKTEYYFALACSVGLMILQPQISRLNSHYSMVYPILPWVFYYLIKIWKKDSLWFPSFIIGLFATIFGLIHMYHFLTISVLCILTSFLNTFDDLSWQNIKKQFVILLFQVAIPFSILYSVSNLIYPASDRPHKVWGFFSYHSSWEGLMFSHTSPLYQFINERIIHIRSIDMIEGVNYIGLPSVWFIILGIIWSIIHIKKIPTLFFQKLNINSKLFWVFLLSALISFGFPFTIHGMGWLHEYTGPFQQFRSIGRVGWISFYAINFLAIPYIYDKLNQFKNKGIKYSLFIMIPLILLAEGYYKLPLRPNPPELESMFKRHEVSPTFLTQAYQALLPDPYLHSGSECFSWPPLGGNQDQFFHIVYELAIPSLAVVMSRQSLKQAALLNQLVCQPYDVPEIITYLKEKDSRPLLVLESTLDLYTKNSSLSHWTKGTQIVYEGQGFRLRELPLNHFDTIVAQFRDSLSKTKIDTLFSKALVFEYNIKEKEWGQDAIMYCDSTTRGEAILAFEVQFKENVDVNAITGVWQITSEHQNVDQFSVRNNYHYKRIVGDKLYIEIPIVIKTETHKIAVRIYKDRQKKGDAINLSNAKIYKVQKIE
ncbi:MAG: hypothetical protein WAT79_12655 [Saprospiraceae bacterium]